jgi:signal transduction histidine kinase
VRRWTGLSLLARFTLTGLALTIAIAVVLGWALGRELERFALGQEAERAADKVGALIDPFLRPEDLDAPMTPERYAQLDELVRARMERQHVVRIKFWGTDGTVRYSTDRSEIGQRFDPAGNDELREALEGEVASELAEPGKEENAGERGYGRLMEVYVPIRLGGEQVVGAYELYHDLELVSPRIERLRLVLWSSIAVAFLVLYLSLYGLVRQASDRERRQTEELGRLAARREADRLQGEFVSIVSHELRNPLTGIVGYAELMLVSEPSADERRTWLARIHAEAERMSRLVDQLLDMSRVESGRIQVARQPVDVAAVVHDVLAPFRAAAADHTFREELVEPLPRASADPEKLAQVLLNLVSNAVKYSPAGGAITVEARPVDGQLRISVSDQGLGIPPEHLSRLFGRFHRVEEADRKGIRGTGLGLYITHQLVELQGGRVWVESPGRGQGSTFHVELPIAADTPSADREPVAVRSRTR